MFLQTKPHALTRGGQQHGDSGDLGQVARWLQVGAVIDIGDCRA